MIVRDTVCLQCLHLVCKLELKFSWGRVQFDPTIFEIFVHGHQWDMMVSCWDEDMRMCSYLTFCKHLAVQIYYEDFFGVSTGEQRFHPCIFFLFLIRRLHWLFLTSVLSDINHFGKLFWLGFCDWQWCWFPDLKKIRRITKFCFERSSFGSVQSISPVLKWRNVVDGDSGHLVNNAETIIFSEEAELLKYMLSSAELHCH